MEMIKMFMTLLSILVPFLAIWLLMGAIAKLTGFAETVTGGMNLVLTKFISYTKSEGNSAPACSYELDPASIDVLIRRIEKYFQYLAKESAVMNSDLINITLIASECKVPLEVIEQEFKNFIREKYNLSAHQILHTHVRLENGRLVLVCAVIDSEKGRLYVQEQNNNLWSRQQERPQNADDEILE